MLIADIPSKFPHAWGYAAGGGFIRPVPDASQIGIQNGAASLHDGFPPNCFVPIAGGGSWPWGQDFNGILNQITAWEQWYQAGGIVVWDSTFSAAVGGYPAAAIVGSTVTFGKFWISTVDNNVTNPDTGGAGWISASAGKLLNIRTFATAGTFTYTPTANTGFVFAEVIGGNAAGGGAVANGAGAFSCGGSGATGGIARSLILSGFAGATLTVGAPGLGVVGAAGTNGGTSSFGAIVSSPGGLGGGVSGSGTAPTALGGAPGATPTGGNICNYAGQGGDLAFGIVSQGLQIPACGKSSPWGSGGAQSLTGSNGNSGKGNGASGAGASQSASGGALKGGDGTPGIIVLWEFSA